MKADIIHRFKRKHFKFNAALTFSVMTQMLLKLKLLEE